MPLEIFPRGKRQTLYIRGTIKGVPVYESTGTSDPKIAEAVRIKTENDILQRSVFGDRATVTFIEAANAYIGSGGKKGGALSNRKHIGVVHQDGSRTLLLKLLGDVRVSAITQADADRAAAKLYPGTKASTRVRHVFGPLKAVLTYAARQGWCGLPVIESPFVETPVTTYSTPERLQKLLPYLNPDIRRFTLVSMLTGARLSEVLRIDWDRDVSLAGRTITLRKTKTGQRTVRVTAHLLIELALVPDTDRHGLMFHWADKCSPHKVLRRACKAAGVEYLPPHQAGRHTYATWMLKYGKASLKEVMEAGGWKSVQSVIRYLHVVEAEAAQKAENFPNIFQADLNKSLENSALCTDIISEIRAKSVQAGPKKTRSA